MALTKNGKVVKKVFYKGKRVRRVYWRKILVFVEGFFTKLLVKMTSNKINGKKNIPNPAWDVWETERQRLANVVASKQSAYDRAAAEAKPYEDAYSSAVRDRDSWLSSHPQPPEQRITQAWKDWNTRLGVLKSEMDSAKAAFSAAFNEWQSAKNAYDSRVESVNSAIDAYNSASQAEKAAVEAYNSHLDSEPAQTIDNPNYDPDPTISVVNPDMASWAAEDTRLYNAYKAAIGTPGEAAAKAAYDSHHATKPPSFIEVPNPNYDPNQTITNPDWTSWESTRVSLKASVDSTRADAEAKYQAAKKASAEWDADEPAYRQRVDEAYRNVEAQRPIAEAAISNYETHLANEPTKMERNPDYDQWLNDRQPYDSAVSSASSALAPYAAAKSSAYSDLQSAQSAYNTHYNTQPAKRIDVDTVYYKYSFNVKLKEQPKPYEKSNDTLSIRVKIDNPQTEADKQDARFIGQDRGPNPAYLSGSLDFNKQNITLTTSWTSMEMRYTNAEITITSTEGFSRTYSLNIDKELTTDDFMFRYPD